MEAQNDPLDVNDNIKPPNWSKLAPNPYHYSSQNWDLTWWFIGCFLPHNGAMAHKTTGCSLSLINHCFRWDNFLGNWRNVKMITTIFRLGGKKACLRFMQCWNFLTRYFFHKGFVLITVTRFCSVLKNRSALAARHFRAEKVEKEPKVFCKVKLKDVVGAGLTNEDNEHEIAFCLLNALRACMRFQAC